MLYNVEELHEQTNSSTRVDEQTIRSYKLEKRTYRDEKPVATSQNH
jgi:hypothetical protein